MLKLFYVVYFTAVGISIPFFGPYLRALGLSGLEIGAMMSVAPLLHLGVPLIWGWAADRTRRADALLTLACAGAAVFLAPLVRLRAVPALLLVYGLHQLFAVAILGLADSLAVDRARRLGEEYGRTRVFGSLSFIAACVGTGAILQARGRGDGDPLVPVSIAIVLAVAALASLGVRGEPGRERPQAHDLRRLLSDRRFLFLLVVAPLHWAAASPYHGFFGVLLRARGLSPTVTSLGFGVGTLAEIAALVFFRNLRRRLPLSTLLALAFGATAVRWLLVALDVPPGLLIASQLLHLLTFGVYWGAAVGWLSECVPPALRATGQTLFTAATFGIGNLIGMLGTGLLYDLTGGVQAAFGAAAALQLVPLALAVTAGRRLDPAVQARGAAVRAEG
jgi:PPP family 3-phenylpropionic acid transporter